MIIDLDSTHSDTFGNQEKTEYNAHYGTQGYHPLVAFDGLTGDFLKAELRSGNVYTSKGVKDFLAPMLTHYRQVLPCTDILVRGDSGFATPEVYDTCESNESFYVIRLKSNKVVEKLAETFVLVGDDHPWRKGKSTTIPRSIKPIAGHQIDSGSESAGVQSRVRGH